MEKVKKARSRLTRKQAVFVDEYIESGNGRQAALIAYDTDNINSAAVIASQNLNKLNVSMAIESNLPEWSPEYVKRKFIELSKSHKEDISLRAAEIMTKCKGIDLQRSSDDTSSTHITINALITDASIGDVVSRLGERLRAASTGAITSKSDNT